MTISLDWIKDHINLEDLNLTQISDLLTDIGLEVEEIAQFESLKGGLKGYLTGEVMSCIKHPDSDHLSLTTVNIGDGPFLNIVCGAPNVKVGQKVVVATVGSIVYFADGKEIEIKKAKIRGVESQGMICAEDELGIGTDHDGILVLEKDTPIGLPAAKIFNVITDTTISIGLTPNRSDAICHKGVAEDLAAALLVRNGKNYSISKTNVPINDGLASSPVKINVFNDSHCIRYCGVVLENITIADSPQWIVNRLKAIGVKPINNVVDITNYILHDLGQPLHAFDLEKIGKKEINVRTLPQDTLFTTLDGTPRKLSSDDLVICDGENLPMCIAGVFGGISSGVSDATTSLFLESACFEPQKTRRASMRHNLRTDAAGIFEKGSDPNLCLNALEIAVDLLVQYAGAVLKYEPTDFYPNPIKKAEILVRKEKIDQMMGFKMDEPQVLLILTALSMNPIPTSQGYLVSVPTNKVDVKREIDVIEEIVRIYGMNNIETSPQIKSAIMHSSFPDPFRLRRKISEYLVNIGFSETMSLSIVKGSKLEPSDMFVRINNTSNSTLDTMRPYMEMSILDNISFNINRQQNQLQMFEFGFTYHQLESGEFVESEQLMIAVTGLRNEESWLSDNRKKSDFFTIKGIVMAIIKMLGIRSVREVDFQNEKYAYETSITYGQKKLAHFGVLDPLYCKTFDIRQEVIVAGFDWKVLLEAIPTEPSKVRELSKFPSVRRDLAIIISDSIAYASIEKSIRNIDTSRIRNVNLFDVYKNDKQLGEGMKSYAISIQFEDMNATMSDTLIDGIMQSIHEMVAKVYNAKIRE